MIECVFYVNDLPGGEGHHDGGMKGRDGAAVLANPMLALSAESRRRSSSCEQRPRKTVVTEARPREGHAESAAHARGREGHSVAGHRQVGDARAPDPKRRMPRSRRNIRTAASSCRAI